MNELLKKRVERKLDTLPDERVYQVLDYIEFLESKYASKSAAAPSPFERLAETVEDTLRAGKLSASAIRGTMDVMSATGRLMSGLAAAGKAVVDQVAGGAAKPGEIVARPDTKPGPATTRGPLAPDEPGPGRESGTGGAA